MNPGEQPAVWKALADPTRRALLEKLRTGPKTTSELCASFSMTRFGVMKHLGVLESSGLVLVRREGRQRFNHLNAVPLRQIYERFVADVAGSSARNLTNLQRAIEGEFSMSDPTTNRSFHIEQEIVLNANRQRVWQALTKDIGQWWAYHLGPDGSEITLDPQLGGMFAERWGDGEGRIWGTVTRLERGTLLTLVGSLGMKGPGTNNYTYELVAEGDKTRIKLSHFAYGFRDADLEANYSQGWQGLLQQHLKAWVEEGTAATPVGP